MATDGITLYAVCVVCYVGFKDIVRDRPMMLHSDNECRQFKHWDYQPNIRILYSICQCVLRRQGNID